MTADNAKRSRRAPAPRGLGPAGRSLFNGARTQLEAQGRPLEPVGKALLLAAARSADDDARLTRAAAAEPDTDRAARLIDQARRSRQQVAGLLAQLGIAPTRH